MLRRFGVTLALGLVLSAALFAKAPTTKIRITGPTLTAPIEITDPALLKNFFVWDWAMPNHEAFVIQYSNTSQPQPPRSWRRYEVTFFADLPSSAMPSQTHERAVYVVTYAFDPTRPQGYIYVPRTPLNGSTISRGGMEEWWFKASNAWEQAARWRITQAEASGR